MTPDTKTENQEVSRTPEVAVNQSAALPPTPTPVPRRNNVPLVLVGFLVVSSAAYFLGRSTANPRTPAAVTVPADEHTEEGHTEGEEGHAEGGQGEEEHRGLIKLDAEAVKTAGIRSEVARMMPLGTSLTVPGTVEVSPNRGAKITPPVPGKVVRLLVSVGQTVSAGQTLAVLDSIEVAEAHAAVRDAESGVQQAQASLQTAQAGVAQARTTLKNAETALAGQKRLAQAGVFSQPSLQAARAAVADAESELLQAQTEAQSHETVLARAERLFKEQLIARAELEQAQAERRQDATRVAQANARVRSAKETLAREERLAQGGLLSRQALQANEAEVRSARGALQKAIQEEQAARTSLTTARSAVASARTSLEAAEGSGHMEGQGGLLALDAPISGIVTERNATLGEAVERTTTLFVVENLQSVQVVASVPEREVARVRTRQRVEVTVAAYPKERFVGVVQSVGSRVDEKTRALPVRILVQNPNGRLKPEMFASVALATGGSESALAVSESAIGEDGDERFVFVEEDGGYERRGVTLGRISNGMVEILSGIKVGERVVTEGVFVLKSEGVKAELKGHEH
jgi:membrane fusion protein, heavy metal efflux system